MASARADEVEEGEMKDDDGGGVDDSPPSVPSSSSTSATQRPPLQISLRTKGRGFTSQFDVDDEARYAGKSGEFETLNSAPAVQQRGSGGSTEAQKSASGYVVLVSGLHEECGEEDVQEAFGEFGPITALHLNLDRRTGYTKGYALLEYGKEEEARLCVEEGDGMEVLSRPVQVGWAFRRPLDHRRAAPSRGRTVRIRDERR